MKALAWGIGDTREVHRKAIRLMLSGVLYGYDLELIGLDLEYKYLKQKLSILYDSLKLMDVDDIVLCMDGFDTLFNRSFNELLNVFNSFNSDIVMSTERLFMYQWPGYKDKFDDIKSEYRYVNSGVYMGRVGSLISMIEEIRQLAEHEDTLIDQGLVGIWVYNNLDNGRVKLDTNCELFWNVSDEKAILSEMAATDSLIRNRVTGTHPFVIHVPGMDTERGIKSYTDVYKNIIDRFEINCPEPVYVS